MPGSSATVTSDPSDPSDTGHTSASGDASALQQLLTTVFSPWVQALNLSVLTNKPEDRRLRAVLGNRFAEHRAAFYR